MSNKKGKKTIFVYADWLGLNEPTLLGVLKSELLRGKEIFSFKYSTDWLKNSNAQLLDPDLKWFSGVQYLNNGEKPNFGLFLDSSPDRWGRLLMRRKEAALARLEKREENLLFETDYLLGVFDGHRMGGLRFKMDVEGPFLSDNKKLASPPWTSISELEQISLKLEDENSVNDSEYLNWLNMLIAPGSSLGGARPKASVLDRKNNLCIAKFPSKYDQFDVGAWEIITHQMAKEAGIRMADAEAKRFSGKHHSFITRRFDRTSFGERIHFASAMTLVGYNDGQDHSDGISYLELVEFISRHGVRVNENLEQLWRRIVFSMCVSNTDDHLRNHGFILTTEGWMLSPAFDINPNETGTGLKLNINENENTLDLDLALEVHPYFRLPYERCLEIISETKSSVKNWRKLAKKYGIPNSEQDLKSRAFRQSEK